MKKIDELFIERHEKVTFIELKEELNYNIKGYPKGKHIPLPILTDVLIEEAKEGRLEEEIKITYIVDGIIYLMGLDSEFKNMEHYIDIALAYNSALEDYIFYNGIKKAEENDFIDAGIYFRSLKLLNPNNINGLFNYGLVLENIAKTYLEKEENEVGLMFLAESTATLESILDLDDKYALAYYKLGYHYKFNDQFLKAKLIWTKALTLDKDELRLQEIRNEIEAIDEDVILETGLTYLNRSIYDKALDAFLKLVPKNEDWWEIKYLTGVAYKALEEYDNAIMYFKQALELNKKEPDLYNELGITLYSIDNIEGALEIFNQAIENIDGDYKLIFNRGLMYLQLGQLNEAYEDVLAASVLNPEDQNVMIQKEALEKALNI